MTFRQLRSDEWSPDLQQRVTALFRQLNEHISPVPLEELLKENNPAYVLACLDGDNLLGMACMATYKVVSGYKGWIEDVIVDQNQRGKGIGRELVKRLIESGIEQGLSEILLFTGHHRKPAIALYESLGFTRKTSHLYQLKIDPLA